MTLFFMMNHLKKQSETEMLFYVVMLLRGYTHTFFNSKQSYTE